MTVAIKKFIIALTDAIKNNHHFDKYNKRIYHRISRYK
jgi:hypothetical protein